MAEHAKKVLIINILKILQKYTDKDHTLTQQQIVDLLRTEFDMTADRTSVKRNLYELIEADYRIQYREISRKRASQATGENEDNTILTDFYYEHDFTEAELHMLIDGVLFSRNVPYRQRRELIDKLGNLSGTYFSKRMNNVWCMAADAPQNRELFGTIDILDEAISLGKQVELTYNYFQTDMQLHPTLDREGNPNRQVINPYQMVASNGRYYLICNNDHYDNVKNYRIDRITNIRMLDTPVKPKSQVEGLEDGLDMQKYMAQNVYMFSGEVADVIFETSPSMVSEVIDWFGKNVHFYERDDGQIECTVHVSIKAMQYWAFQYATSIRVLRPQSLVEAIKQDLIKASAGYGMECISGS